ncbi:hypothetical protein H311_03324 [Anncaliia algerae PRA109]|nr:hypothetical protein H311_03324 [Anncaliia algerae PRA109]
MLFFILKGIFASDLELIENTFAIKTLLKWSSDGPSVNNRCKYLKFLSKLKEAKENEVGETNNYINPSKSTEKKPFLRFQSYRECFQYPIGIEKSGIEKLYDDFTNFFTLRFIPMWEESSSHDIFKRMILATLSEQRNNENYLVELKFLSILANILDEIEKDTK